MAKRFLLLILCGAAAWSQDSLSHSLPGGMAAQASSAPRSGERQSAAFVPNSATDKQIEALQARVKRTSGDYSGYDQLGAAFFQKARETGDISYYDLAEQTLKKSLDLVPKDFRAADPLVHLCLVYMGEHRFSDVLTYAQKAIALGSGNLPAFAVEGDAYTDMGDYLEASSAYNTVQSLGGATSSPVGLHYMLDSRKAYLSFLHGDSVAAIELMSSAITAGLQTDVPRENLAWLYFELGERYFQSGDLANAEQSYGAGMAADHNHYRSLAGLAKVRAAQGKFEEAAQLYQRSTAIIPFPQYLAELGDLYEKMGRPNEAAQQYDLVEYIAHLSRLNQVLANRELALFYADHGIKLAKALEFARKELDVRHDIYTWDTLAWVLYKNGKMQEAADTMKKALTLNTVDSLLLFHAGMIEHSLGRDTESEQFLSHALQANPHFHIFYADLARRTLQDIAKPQHVALSNQVLSNEHSQNQDLRSGNARE